MFFGAHSIIFETLFVFAGKITFRFSPRALFDLPDLFVYALFTQTKKKALAISRKCLITNVDQPGLEPGTSRL